MSTAPYSSALRVVAAPLSQAGTYDDGNGVLTMIFCRNVNPSIRGISMSNRITSGTWALILSAATKGSDAVALTSMAGSPESISLKVWRTTAESSTMRTRIFGLITN